MLKFSQYKIFHSFAILVLEFAQYEKLCLTKGDHYSKWCGTGRMHREEKCSTEHVNKQCRCLFKAVQYFVNHKIYFFVLFPNVRVSFCVK